MPKKPNVKDVIAKLPPTMVAYLDNAIGEVTAQSQMYMDCVHNSDDHVMLVVVPLFVDSIGSFVYDDANMQACESWLGRKVNGECPWYSLPVAGNRNVDNLARELAKAVIQTYRRGEQPNTTG
jgi:hypothetical protein